MIIEQLVQLMQEHAVNPTTGRIGCTRTPISEAIGQAASKTETLVDKLSSASGRGAMSTNFFNLSFEVFDPSAKL